MKSWLTRIGLATGLGLGLTCCESLSQAHLSAEDAFGRAKETYDSGSYKLALEQLSEFRSRYPYSQYTREADLWIANAHLELHDYPAAAAEYAQFTELHPSHPKVEFAHFRRGLAFWRAAPEAPDREQEFARQAIQNWEITLAKFPNGTFADEIKKLIQQGRERILQSSIRVAEFYCKKEIWHACAHRFEQAAAAAPDTATGRDLRRRAAAALQNLVEHRDPEAPARDNLYQRDYSAAQLRAYIERLRVPAAPPFP